MQSYNKIQQHEQGVQNSTLFDSTKQTSKHNTLERVNVLGGVLEIKPAGKVKYLQQTPEDILNQIMAQRDLVKEQLKQDRDELKRIINYQSAITKKEQITVNGA